MSEAERDSYKRIYETFDAPLNRALREEAYGEDIGQHSWVTADELRADIARLCLSGSNCVLDLGCGPGGPLTFIAQTTGCVGVGLDVSAAAIDAARARSARANVAHLVTFRQTDLDEPLDLEDASFDAVLSLDVILHLRDRAACFRSVKRMLKRRGRFLFTDASVLTGAVSNAEFALRSGPGRTKLVPPGFNEKALGGAGLRVFECEDRTASVLRNAAGRLRARLAHRGELEAVEGAAAFEQQQRYLECVVALSERKALSRLMYLAEV